MLPHLLILAVFILAACGQSEPPAKGEAGPPGPAGPAVPGPSVRPLVPVPAPTDQRSRLSHGSVIKRPVARVARRMSKSSMPMRSIQEASSAI